MNINLKIIAHRSSTTYAEQGNVDEVEVSCRYAQSRADAHKALDKVLDALGMEDS